MQESFQEGGEEVLRERTEYRQQCRAGQFLHPSSLYVLHSPPHTSSSNCSQLLMPAKHMDKSQMLATLHLYSLPFYLIFFLNLILYQE